jgi:hypothetical protein
VASEAIAEQTREARENEEVHRGELSNRERMVEIGG